jgi:hypothetical protein
MDDGRRAKEARRLTLGTLGQQDRLPLCVGERVHDRRKTSAMRPQRLRQTLACIPSV